MKKDFKPFFLLQATKLSYTPNNKTDLPFFFRIDVGVVEEVEVVEGAGISAKKGKISSLSQEAENRERR